MLKLLKKRYSWSSKKQYLHDVMVIITLYFFTNCKQMKFSIKDFFSKCEQIRRKLYIWSHLLKKSLMENCIFCAVTRAAMNNNVINKFNETHFCSVLQYTRNCVVKVFKMILLLYFAS